MKNNFIVCIHSFLLSLALQPSAGYGLLLHEVSWSHNDAPQSVGLLWTINQLVAESCTWQHTTIMEFEPTNAVGERP
jgi:hypothetical protein